MNRRGHLPTIMLVPIAIALIIVTWLTFLNFDTDIDESATPFQLLTRDAEFGEAYVRGVFRDSVQDALDITGEQGILFETAFIQNFETRVLERDLGFDISREFFDAVAEGEGNGYELDFGLSEDGIESYTLRFDDIGFVVKVGESSISRNLDLTAEFNEVGIIRVS